jgi:hypothetical protein
LDFEPLIAWGAGFFQPREKFQKELSIYTVHQSIYGCYEMIYSLNLYGELFSGFSSVNKSKQSVKEIYINCNKPR